MVATEASLLEGAAHLNPEVVVVDLSLSSGDMSGLLHRIAERAPGANILLLSVHDERTIAESALAAGAHAVVLKRCLATDLMPAVDAVLAGNVTCHRESRDGPTDQAPQRQRRAVVATVRLPGRALSVVVTFLYLHS